MFNVFVFCKQHYSRVFEHRGEREIYGFLHILYVHSYKQFTLVNYDSRVVIWGIFKSGTTLES